MLGEQYPSGPQSESTRQLLPVRQTLLALLALEVRHSQGTPPSQSGSPKHSSYEHTS
jgi:hypothetical protein